MYESRFGISGPPFQLSPDPSFYFDSRGHHRALAALRRALFEDVGLIMVTGEVGAGKTTLVRTLLGELDERARAVAHVVSTQLNAEDLLGAVLIGFGVPPEGAPQDELMSKLDRLLSRLSSEARRAVLIVDEAQNLGPDAFRQLAAIAASGSSAEPTLQVCLVGQPELRAMLETAPMLYLRELIGVSFHLGPIERDEAGPYVEHRLRCVGWSHTPSFEPAAFDEIYRWTSGVPRRMNLLCNRLMLSCFLNAEAKIDAAKVAQTARELRAEIGEAPLEEPAVDPRRPEESPVHQGAMPQASPRAPMHAPVLPDSLAAPVETGSLLCVAAGYSDHIKAAALLRALARGRDATRVKLVSVYNDDAFVISRGLFDGWDVDASMVQLGMTRDGEGVLSELMKVFRFVVDHVLPRAVVVFDGSETALVCSSVASGKDIPVIHVGAGLRVDRPVEAGQMARQSIDELADLLYTTDAQASETLAAEGIAAERVHCVGNLLVDALHIVSEIQPGAAADRARPSIAEPYLVNRSGYGLVVINQPVNIDSGQSLQDCLAVLHDVSRDLRLVWPMQRVTEARLKHFQLHESLAGDRIICLPPQPYADYVALLRAATCVLTDSWSVQEEATALSIPCITLGRYPERAITVSVGSNIPVGGNHAFAARVVWECIFNGGKRGRVPELWDGKTAGRIASYLRAWLACNTEDPHDAVAGFCARVREWELPSSGSQSFLSGR